MDRRPSPWGGEAMRGRFLGGGHWQGREGARAVTHACPNIPRHSRQQLQRRAAARNPLGALQAAQHRLGLRDVPGHLAEPRARLRGPTIRDGAPGCLAPQPAPRSWPGVTAHRGRGRRSPGAERAVAGRPAQRLLLLRARAASDAGSPPWAPDPACPPGPPRQAQAREMGLVVRRSDPHPRNRRTAAVPAALSIASRCAQTCSRTHPRWTLWMRVRTPGPPATSAPPRGPRVQAAVSVPEGTRSLT